MVIPFQGNHYMQLNPNQVVYGNGQRYQPCVQNFGTEPSYPNFPPNYPLNCPLNYPPNYQHNPQPNPQPNYPLNHQYNLQTNNPPNYPLNYQHNPETHYPQYYSSNAYPPNSPQPPNPYSSRPPIRREIIHFGNTPGYYWHGCWYNCGLPRPRTPAPQQVVQQPESYVMGMQPPVAPPPPPQPIYQIREPVAPPQPPPQSMAHDPRLQGVYMMTGPPQMPRPQLPTTQQVPLSYCVMQPQPGPRKLPPELQAPQVVEIVLGPSIDVTRTDDKLILDFRGLHPPRPVPATPNQVNESEQISEDIGFQPSPPAESKSPLPSGSSNTMPSTNESAEDGSQNSAVNAEKQLEIIQCLNNVAQDVVLIAEHVEQSVHNPAENLDMVEQKVIQGHPNMVENPRFIPAQCLDLPTSQPENEPIPVPVPNLVAEQQETEQSSNATSNEVKKPNESETFYEDLSVNKATELEKQFEVTQVIQENFDLKSHDIADIEKGMDQLHIADPLPDLVTQAGETPVQNERIDDSKMTCTLPITIPPAKSIGSSLLKVIKQENITSNILQPIKKSDRNISVTHKKKLPVPRKPQHKSIGASLLQVIEKENITSTIQKPDLSVPQKPLNQWPPLETRPRTRLAPIKKPLAPGIKLQKTGSVNSLRSTRSSFGSRKIFKSVEQKVPPAVELKINVPEAKTAPISPAKRIEGNIQQGVRKNSAKPKVKKSPEIKSPPTKKPMVILEKREAPKPVTDSLVTISNMFELLLDEPETQLSEVDDDESFQPEAQKTGKLVPQKAVNSKKEKRRLKKISTAQKKLELSEKKAAKEALRAKKAADKAKDLESSQTFEKCLASIKKNEVAYWQLTDLMRKSSMKPIGPPPPPGAPQPPPPAPEPPAPAGVPERKRKSPGLSKFLSAVNVAALKQVVAKRRELFEKRKPASNDLDINPTLRLRPLIPAGDAKEPTQSTPSVVPPPKLQRIDG
nr:titin [Drosophila takahashii]